MLLSFHHQPSPAGCIWALAGAEMVNAHIQPGLEPPVLVTARMRSKKGIVYALGMFRGRAAYALLHPLRQQDVSGGCLLCPFSGDICACGSEPGTTRTWLSPRSLPGSTSKSAAALAQHFSGHAGCVVPGDGLQPAQGAGTCRSAGSEQNWDGSNEVMGDDRICCLF